ncbi:MAG TPA: helix-turn-helix domain-containing protein [Actinomycetota bacterium]|nr:helix-turn-helix domain-containing protein [Actinomycetota bacterium]
MVTRTETQYLRTAQVARLLHVSPKTISRWAKEQKLPYVMTLGGHRRFPAEAIADIVSKLSSGGPQALEDSLPINDGASPGEEHS